MDQLLALKNFSRHMDTSVLFASVYVPRLDNSAPLSLKPLRSKTTFYTRNIPAMQIHAHHS